MKSTPAPTPPAAPAPDPERGAGIIGRTLELMRTEGFGWSKAMEAAGAQFGITRERARQIEARALQKLRHPSLGRGLRSYLEE